MAQTPPLAATDPFDEVLHRLRATGTFYCHSRLSAPWGLRMPPMPGCIWFHAVTTGGFAMSCDDDAPIDVRAGEFVLIPHGRGHDVRTSADVPTPCVLDLPHDNQTDHYAELRYGGGGAVTTVICGLIRLEHPFGFDLDALLPRVVHLDADRLLDAAWMQSTLRLIGAESKAPRPGGETIITRLCDVLVIQAVRAWLETESMPSGWLRALRDDQLGRAMMLAHRQPERHWSVATLASEAGMSRSGFAARFHDYVGEPPMQYVTRLRMKLARAKLVEQQCSIAELASELGYRSEAAFSRAFKRFIGRTPGAVRRSGQTTAPQRKPMREPGWAGRAPAG